VAATPEREVVWYASFRRRAAGLLYESLLGLGILALGFLVPSLIIGMIFEVAAPGWLLWLHVFLVLGAYFVWYWGTSGQTLAMQTWRLKVVRQDDGRALSFKQAMIRYAWSWPSLLLGGVGLLWAFVDRDKQFLHDRLAGTCLVELPPVRKS